MKTKQQLAEERYSDIFSENIKIDKIRELAFISGYDAALANIDWDMIEIKWRMAYRCDFDINEKEVFNFIKNIITSK